MEAMVVSFQRQLTRLFENRFCDWLNPFLCSLDVLKKWLFLKKTHQTTIDCKVSIHQVS